MKQKNVRFHADQQIFLVRNRKDLSEQEHEAMHFLAEDYLEMRVREKNLQKMLDRSGTNEEEQFGLRTKKGKEARRSRLRESHISVLLEQELQTDEEVKDPHHIARLYEHYTRESRRLAHIRGLNMAFEARRNQSSVVFGEFHNTRRRDFTQNWSFHCVSQDQRRTTFMPCLRPEQLHDEMVKDTWKSVERVDPMLTTSVQHDMYWKPRPQLCLGQ